MTPAGARTAPSGSSTAPSGPSTVLVQGRKKLIFSQTDLSHVQGAGGVDDRELQEDLQQVQV